MALLEIIKRTTIKFFQTKSIAFLSPSAQKKSAASLTEQSPEALVPGVRAGGRRPRSGFGGHLCSLESHGFESPALRSLPQFLSREIPPPPNTLSKQKSLKLAGLFKSERRC